MGLISWFVNNRLNKEAKKEGSMLKKILDFLSGKKAYIVAVATLLGTIGKVLTDYETTKVIDWSAIWEGVIASGAIASLRAAITKSK